MINKEIKNENGTIDMVVANSVDEYDVIIGDNYKLVKFSHSKRSFKDTILGTDIGVNSKGFGSVTIISLLMALVGFGIMYFSFRI